ncbi:hypothetical protein PYW07_008358 [Mythimna separata]|uniref:Peptidase S1 domain-containing protein n=1 Tax=Mythimna separata TaxID=271217 RepID=A0AAD7YCY6_MYTSE|nr:hypothetical protein PYW07_008358 [Mythimna separata]
MDKNSVCFPVLVLILLCQCSFSNGSCNDIFGFYTDSSKTVFGQITLQPVEVVPKLVITITYTVQARLDDNNLGSIESPDRILDKYNKGETVKYRVYFPVVNPRPKVIEITLNGKTLCTGQGDKLTSESSQPTLQLTNYYGAGGGPPPYRRFQQQTQTPPPPPVVAPARPGPPLQIVHIPQSATPSKDHAWAFVQHLGNRFGSDDTAGSPLHPFIFETPAPPVTTTTKKPTPPPKLEYVTQSTTPKPRPVNRYTPSSECGVVDIELVYKGQSYERGRMPWLVAIFRTKRKSLEFRCGGTLVSDRHVVTAAHCKQVRGDTLDDSEIVVRLGVHALDEWDDITVPRKIMSATMYESYDGSRSLQDDLMVITLMKRVKFHRYIRPACLWSGDTELSRVVGQTGDVAGWGDRGETSTNQLDEPQLVRMPIVSTKDCRANNSFFHEVTFNTTFCAGDLKGAGPCTGDSGSGLYLREDGKWRLRGVVSLSLQSTSRTCNLNEYVVFTDTAQYLPWIRNILSRKYFD